MSRKSLFEKLKIRKNSFSIFWNPVVMGVLYKSRHTYVLVDFLTQENRLFSVSWFWKSNDPKDLCELNSKINLDLIYDAWFLSNNRKTDFKKCILCIGVYWTAFQRFNSWNFGTKCRLSPGIPGSKRKTGPTSTCFIFFLAWNAT